MLRKVSISFPSREVLEVLQERLDYSRENALIRQETLLCVRLSEVTSHLSPDLLFHTDMPV
jgi:hypothetical protein